MAKHVLIKHKMKPYHFITLPEDIANVEDDSLCANKNTESVYIVLSLSCSFEDQDIFEAYIKFSLILLLMYILLFNQIV